MIQAASLRDTVRRYMPIALLSLLYFAIRLLYCGHVPIWDERIIYEDAVLGAQEKPFDLLNYSGSGNHNSELWMLLAGLPNYFFPYSYYAYHLWVALLGTTGVIAFYFIVTALSGKAFSTAERILLTALFAFHPSLFANQVRVTLDTGLLLFWVWYLLALLKERTALAAIAGCFLLLSKEPAIGHLPILFIFCALLKPRESQVVWAKRHAMAIAVPLAMLALFLIYKTAFRSEMLFFQGFLQKSSDLIFILPDSTLVNYALMVFVLNFNWVLTLLCLMLTALWWRQSKADYWPRYRGQIIAFAWLFASTLCVVIGVRHWAHVRYVLPVFPAMLLYFAYLLPVISKTARIALLLALLAVFGWQNFRSVDPVSNAVFCTTKFGEHSVLNIQTNKVCGLYEDIPWLGRDGWIYNLEFTKVSLLMGDIMKDVRPDANTVFAVPEMFSWELFTGLDAHYDQTFARDAIKPKILPIGSIDDPQLLKNLPDTLYYIEFPTDNIAAYRQFFAAHYAQTTEKRYDSDGYQLTLLRYEHKVSE